MSVPPRPEHANSRFSELQQRLKNVRERARLDGPGRGSKASFGQPSHPLVMHAHGAPDEVAPEVSSMLPGVLIGVAFALLGLGAIWGWQTWANRVSEPIDARLPMLVSTEMGAEAGLSPTETATARPEEQASADESPKAAAPSSAANDSPAQPAPVVVHVAGAVASPGVVELRPGDRIVDALAAAGGAAADADLDRVNLAAIVVDGERIHVPAVGELEPPVVVAPARDAGLGEGASSRPGGEPPVVLLDINVATALALEALPGIGPSIAQAIVQSRVNRGPFLSVDELLDVPGIGDAKLAQIEPYVLVGS